MGIKEFHVAKALLEGQQEPHELHSSRVDRLQLGVVFQEEKGGQVHFTVERWN